MSKLEEKFRQLTIDEDGTEVQQCLEITEQECIGFAEWVFNECKGWSLKTIKRDTELTDSELFQLYQKSKENETTSK